MSLVKTAISVGGGSLQVYQKDGNNLHTEFIEEWILLEDRGLVANTDYFWRLGDRQFNIRLISLWATTTGNITLTLQQRGTNLFAFPITNAQAANGFPFPPLILPSKFDLVVRPAQAVTQLFLTAKEVAIAENLTLSRT